MSRPITAVFVLTFNDAIVVMVMVMVNVNYSVVVTKSLMR